jgi:uncharacterized membrane protein
MDDKETGRVESFSDGVFAIAVTLLVLDVTVPRLADPTQAELAKALRGELIPLFAFVLSFASVVIMWTNHHRLFRLAHHVDGQLLFANGLLLMLVALCPVPTALLAEYLGQDAGRLAAAVYAAYFVLVNVAYNLVLEAIARAPHGSRHGADRATVGQVRRNLRFGFVAYVLAAAAAWISAWITIAICALLWAFWARAAYQAARPA